METALSLTRAHMLLVIHNQFWLERSWRRKTHMSICTLRWNEAQAGRSIISVTDYIWACSRCTKIFLLRSTFKSKRKGTWPPVLLCMVPKPKLYHHQTLFRIELDMSFIIWICHVQKTFSKENPFEYVIAGFSTKDTSISRQ